MKMGMTRRAATGAWGALTDRLLIPPAPGACVGYCSRACEAPLPRITVPGGVWHGVRFPLLTCGAMACAQCQALTPPFNFQSLITASNPRFEGLLPCLLHRGGGGGGAGAAGDTAAVPASGGHGNARLAHQDSEFTDDGNEKPAAVVPAGSDGGVLIGAKRGAAGGVRYGSRGYVQINHKDLRPSYTSKLLFLVSGLAAF